MVSTLATNEDWVERLQRALGDEPASTPNDYQPLPVCVLVLDDDPVDRRAMVRTLRDLPRVGEVVEAASIADATRAITSGSIEIAFFDFRLPDGESIDLLPLAIEHGVTVIVVTGAGNEKIAVRAMSSGAVGYLIKDVAGEYLTLMPAKLTQYVHSRSLEAERLILLRRIEEALEMVRFMGSFVSMCCVCKKIKVTGDQWEPIDAFISQRSSTQFSHGYCPHCFEGMKKEFGV